MGFLSVNTRKRPGLYPKKGSKRLKTQANRSRSRSATPQSSSRHSSPVGEGPSPPPLVQFTELSLIERFPREILEYIFIMSRNFNLPQASHTLARKLSRSPNLEFAILNALVEANGNRMPTYVVRWPFVTTELLSKVNFEEFTGNWNGGSGNSSEPFVPFAIEQSLGIDSNLTLAALMVERGCKVEDSVRIYSLFASQGYWKAVNAMIRNRQRSNSEVVVLALREGLGAEFAIQLLSLAHGIHEDWNQIWAVQQAALEARVPEVSAYINSG